MRPIQLPAKIEDSQEQCKVSDLLKWLILPIQVSSIAVIGDSVTYQE